MSKLSREKIIETFIDNSDISDEESEKEHLSYDESVSEVGEGNETHDENQTDASSDEENPESLLNLDACGESDGQIIRSEEAQRPVNRLVYGKAKKNPFVWHTQPNFDQNETEDFSSYDARINENFNHLKNIEEFFALILSEEILNKIV